MSSAKRLPFGLGLYVLNHQCESPLSVSQTLYDNSVQQAPTVRFKVTEVNKSFVSGVHLSRRRQWTGAEGTCNFIPRFIRNVITYAGIKVKPCMVKIGPWWQAITYGMWGCEYWKQRNITTKSIHSFRKEPRRRWLFCVGHTVSRRGGRYPWNWWSSVTGRGVWPV